MPSAPILLDIYTRKNMPMVRSSSAVAVMIKAFLIKVDFFNVTLPVRTMRALLYIYGESGTDYDKPLGSGKRPGISVRTF